MSHLIRIILDVVASDADLVTDRLDGCDEEYPGCPLNLLPRAVEAMEAWGEEHSACPSCRVNAKAWVVRDAAEAEVVAWAEIRAALEDS